MKIYNEITLEWNEDTKRYDNVVSENSYEYDGELELAQQADRGMARFLMGTGIMRHNIDVEDALEELKKTQTETKSFWDKISGGGDFLSSILSLGSMFIPGVKEWNILKQALLATGVGGLTKVATSAVGDVLAPDVDVPGKIKQLQTGTKDRPAIGIKDWEKIAEGYGDIGQQSRGAGLRMRQGALFNLPGEFIQNLMQSYVQSKIFPTDSGPTAPPGPKVPPLDEQYGGAGFAEQLKGAGVEMPYAVEPGVGHVPSLDELSKLKAAIPGSRIPAFQLPSPPDLGMARLGSQQLAPFQNRMQLSPTYPPLAALPKWDIRQPMPAWNVPLMLPSEYFPEPEGTPMGYPTAG